MHHNDTRNSNGNNGRNRGEHAAPSAGAQRGRDEYDRDDRAFDTSADLNDSRYAQRRTFGGQLDNGRAYEDAREANGGRASEGGFIGEPSAYVSHNRGDVRGDRDARGDRDFRGERDDRPVMGSRYGYDDDRRFGTSGHEPQRFNHDTDDGRWGRDHDYNPDYHHHHSYTRGYDAAMRDLQRRDPRRDDPQAGRSAFEAPFDQTRRRR